MRPAFASDRRQRGVQKWRRRLAHFDSGPTWNPPGAQAPYLDANPY